MMKSLILELKSVKVNAATKRDAQDYMQLLDHIHN